MQNRRAEEQSVTTNTVEETLPLLAEYTSTSQRVSGKTPSLMILMVTYLPYILGRQKKDFPCPGGTLCAPPHLGFARPPLLDMEPKNNGNEFVLRS